MILTSLFSELAVWLSQGRDLVCLPTPSRFEEGETELSEVGWVVASGRPAAIFTSKRVIQRMLAGPGAGEGCTRPLLAPVRRVGPRVDRVEPGPGSHGVTHLLDLGGTFIPGQSCPLWVILTGPALTPTVRVMRCHRGEPETFPSPEQGKVFRTIVEGAWDRVGTTKWTDTVDVLRAEPAWVAQALSGGLHGLLDAPEPPPARGLRLVGRAK